MKPFKNNVAVLFLFFARPEQTRQVFAAIKEARPSKLFLYQDGPRKGKNDMEGILACRKIVEDIDWECEVHKMYLEKNQGCDPSEYLSQKWMFSIVDKGIVLEDDDVPNQSFFPFCKELLDKYEHDQRINIICGMNNLGTYNCGDADYFFSPSGSIWGWASWKRVIDEWEPNYEVLQNDYVINCLKRIYGKKYIDNLVTTCKLHYDTGREHYETILGLNMFVKGRYNIVPARNMISNIGIAEISTHSTSNILELPRAIRKVFNMKTYDLSFPMKHPKYIVGDMKYLDAITEQLGGNWFVRTFKIRRIEAILNKHFPFFAKL